jgi:NADH-quinone oxidoreductase subunit A|tara:strand:- start:36 stop:515 length:480 start_codon:yes stop_codon:yes gene_type:complete
MLGQYLPVVALFVLAALFAAISFVVSRLLAPRRPHDRKLAPYECGIIPSRETPERFPVRFYLVAMIFIVFDIEIVFFYPWAVAHRGIGLFGLLAVLIFSVAVFESFVYLIGNGALEWGPIAEVRQAVSRRFGSEVVRPGVRQVGLEGRDVGNPTSESAT